VKDQEETVGVISCVRMFNLFILGMFSFVFMLSKLCCQMKC